MAEGEVGLELDTGKFKFGDGATVWIGRPYAGSAGQQQFFSHAGDPNGAVLVTGPLPCQCWDSVNNQTWVKDDGIVSNTGWH
jgi:hypothetical protein